MASISLNPHQHTLKNQLVVMELGFTLATGYLTIRPASENSGIRFFRTDLDDKNGIPAHMDKVVDTRLATTIADKEMYVSTTEHIMAALQGYGVDNATLELDGAEVPIMDGSAGPFMLLLKKAGLKNKKPRAKSFASPKKLFSLQATQKLKFSPTKVSRSAGKSNLKTLLSKPNPIPLISPPKILPKKSRMPEHSAMSNRLKNSGPMDWLKVETLITSLPFTGTDSPFSMMADYDSATNSSVTKFSISLVT